MTSIQELVEEFEQIKEEQPLLGDWIIFNEVIEEQGLSRTEIREFFNLIQPMGYNQKEEDALLRSADRLTRKRN